jgi:hypothetical protein
MEISDQIGPRTKQRRGVIEKHKAFTAVDWAGCSWRADRVRTTSSDGDVLTFQSTPRLALPILDHCSRTAARVRDRPVVPWSLAALVAHATVLRLHSRAWLVVDVANRVLVDSSAALCDRASPRLRAPRSVPQSVRLVPSFGNEWRE